MGYGLIANFLGFGISAPRRKRYLSEIELKDLRAKINVLENVISEIQNEILKAKQLPELKTIPKGLTDRDDGYPSDWEQISLDYRRKKEFMCEDCGSFAPDGHVHHCVPVSKGGSSNEDNLIFLCKHCHKLRHPHMEIS